MLSIEKYEKSINLENLMSKNDINELILRDFQKGKTINIELSSNISYKSELTNNGEDLTLTFNDNAQTFKIVLKGMVEILNSNDGSDLIKLIQTDTENTYSISDLASALEASAAGGEVITQGDGTQNPTQNNELTFDNTPTLAERLDIDNELTQNGFLPLFVNLNQNNDETGISSILYSGKLIDGYIAGSTVFIDSNNNGSLDIGENSTTTDANGDFSFTGLTQTELDAGPIVAFGGTDISTGLPFEGFYTAPTGSTTVSPLSTLLHELVKDGLTESEAEDLIATTFGLDTNIDLLNYDPIQEQNPQVQIVAVQIANLVNLSAALFSNLEGGSEADASLLAFDYLAQILQNNPQFDLSNSADIETFMREITNDNPTLDFEGISSSIANINVQVEESINALDPFATMAEIQRVQVENLENKFTSNDAPVSTEESNIVEENDLNDVTIGGTEIVDYNFTGSVAGNATDVNGDDMEYSYAGNLNISLSTTNMSIVSALNNPSPEFTQVLKTYFLELVSNPLVSAVIDDSQKLQEIEAYLLDPTTTINDAITYLNNLAPVNIDLTTGKLTIEGVISEKYVDLLQTNNVLSIDVQSDGTYTLNSPYFNLLTPNEKLEINFDYQVSDGILVDSSTISLTVNGGNEAPVITVAPTITINETSFADYGPVSNYETVISASALLAMLGVEDAEDSEFGLSLVRDSSSFADETGDITSSTTNGVIQLTQADLDGDFADLVTKFGAQKGDLYVYSEEVDGLDLGESITAKFNVLVTDPDGNQSNVEEVTLDINGVDEAPVITVAPTITINETSFADYGPVSNYETVISASALLAMLGVEDTEDSEFGLSLVRDSSSFADETGDITSSTTNGVIQLTQADLDGDFADLVTKFGAQKGDLYVYSEEVDGLDLGESITAKFNVLVTDPDGNQSNVEEVTLDINGVDEAPVITVAPTITINETSFADYGPVSNYETVISASALLAMLGVEDTEDSEFGLSLVRDSSSFADETGDITSSTTNGVIQLTQADLDGDFADLVTKFGAQKGDLYVYSEEVDGLDLGESITAKFNVLVTDPDGNQSNVEEVTLDINGVDEAPVITVAPTITINETSFADYGPVSNYETVISASALLAMLGVEDTEDSEFGLSLVRDSSSFADETGDITSSTTNGVIQLTQADLDGDFADLVTKFGAQKGDLYVYSEEVDGLDLGESITAKFNVLVTDPDGNQSNVEEVTLDINGVDEAPVITVAPTITINETSFADYGPVSNYETVISASALLAMLGVEDAEDSEFGLSLVRDSSSFADETGDITSSTTNGVIQLTQADLDGDFADLVTKFGAQKGDLYVYSEEVDGLDLGESITAKFNVLVTDPDGNQSNVEEVTLDINGVDEAPVITVAPTITINETSFADYGPVSNYETVISASALLAMLGVEDTEDSEFGLSLVRDSSSFADETGDITSSTTNGVIQLTQADLDGDFADLVTKFGAQKGDLYVYSEEVDGLDLGESITAKFNVLVTDPDGNQSNVEEVTLDINGVDEAPVITVAPTITINETSFADYGPVSNYETVISASALLAMLGVEDAEDSEFGLSLVRDSSSFADETGDITSSTTNGVIQLTQADLDGDFADLVTKFGAQKGDLYVYSEEVDGLDLGESITAKFNVLVTDPDGNQSNVEEVTLDINGENPGISISNNSVTLGDISSSDAGLYNMLEILESASGAKVESIDLTEDGMHILSNLSIDNFLAISDDNELKIDGDSSDKIALDSTIWGNSTPTADGYEEYTYTDSSNQTLKLLIDQDITVI